MTPSNIWYIQIPLEEFPKYCTQGPANSGWKYTYICSPHLRKCSRSVRTQEWFWAQFFECWIGNRLPHVYRCFNSWSSIGSLLHWNSWGCNSSLERSNCCLAENLSIHSKNFKHWYHSWQCLGAEYKQGRMRTRIWSNLYWCRNP